MSEWIAYTGTNEQIEEMRNAEHGFIIRSRGIESKIMHKIDRRGLLVHCDDYLICEEHPLADMIERWAETGQPVWVKTSREISYAGLPILDERIQKTNKPDWNIPGAEYSFNPFSEK